MPKIAHCTAQLTGGEFCEAPSIEDAPFPICQRHAFQVWTRVSHLLKAELRIEGAKPDPREKMPAGHFVYYLQMGDRVKIGFTRNLRGRIDTLMVKPTEVLAVEPGNLRLERQRHREFDEYRIDDREFFTCGPRLMVHVEKMRAAHSIWEVADLAG